MAELSLRAVVYCAPNAQRVGGGPLKGALSLPDNIAASRFLENAEISDRFVSPYLRSNDVPLAFHRESTASLSSLRSHQEAAHRLESEGRRLQYIFSDGLILHGNQVLYHPHSKVIPRHLLPLSLNVRSDIRDRERSAARPSWLVEAEQVTLAVLMAALRAAKIAEMDEDAGARIDIFASLEEDIAKDRAALRLNSIEFTQDGWGPWRLMTALPEPHGHVHYGRARVELEPEALGESHSGISEKFAIDLDGRRLIFHSFEEQLLRLRAQTSVGAEKESGLSLHLSGHSRIQATIAEINDLWAGDGRKLPIVPASTSISKERVRPRLLLSADGSMRLNFLIETPSQVWEAHGLPQSSAYLLLSLQNGLGASTGLANAQIAHTRRGIKRDRDIKILRHLGYAMLIFFEAANFALGKSLSDGTVAKSENDVCESIFNRLGSLILKSEGWPVQTGSLHDLCSKNVTTLIEGFVKQVVGDLQGRDISIYLPSGELRLEGVSRAVALIYHAVVNDLAMDSSGACFMKARTKYFEDFLHGRTAGPEREDFAVREAVDPEVAARMIYQPGIGERYLLPESSRPPRRTELLALLNNGFEISIDGKVVEEFAGTDFRPEFELRESDGNDIIPIGQPKIDWFELHPKFFFKGNEISGEQALRLSREGLLEFQGKLYRIRPEDMPSLNRLNRFWSSIQSPSAGMMRSKRRRTEETYYHLPRSQTLELLALRASGVKVRGGPKWDQVTKFYDSLDQARPAIELPASFQAKLQPYQESGVRWISDLQNLGLGGILADDMGLGKTVTSLAFLEILRARDEMGPTLILVPTSLTYNWQSEAARFAPQMPVHIFSSREPEAALDHLQRNPSGAAIICTYGLLQEHLELFQQVRWATVIFDEAQNLKNITTKRTTASRKLEARFKLCLSGTPLENHYGELFSLFDLIVPGSLGDLPMFRERYVNPTRVLKEDIDFLRLKTKPLLLRRTKSQVMHELPPKIESTVKLPFDEQQKKIYRDIATSYNEQVRQAIAKQGEAKTQLQMLTALLRLRQACSDPASIPGVKYEGEPPKVITLIEALQEVVEGGASALVFTQFLSTFERIRRALSAAKIQHFDISGADSRLSREKKLRAFQEESGGCVMLMTLKTGGVGLNLVKASYIFHIEPWWNPAVENQATDRAHRIGQTKAVQVYRYLIKDSVEEKIELLKDIKSKRFDALFASSEDAGDLGGTTQGPSALSQADFEYLLS